MTSDNDSAPRPLEIRHARAELDPEESATASEAVRALRDLAQRRGFQLQGDDRLLELLSACEVDPGVPEPLLEAVSVWISFLIELEERQAGLSPPTPPG